MSEGIKQFVFHPTKATLISIALGDELWYTTGDDGDRHYHWLGIGSTINKDFPGQKLYYVILPFIAFHFGNAN